MPESDELRQRVVDAIRLDNENGVGGEVAKIIREQRALGDKGPINILIDEAFKDPETWRIEKLHA